MSNAPQEYRPAPQSAPAPAVDPLDPYGPPPGDLKPVAGTWTHTRDGKPRKLPPEIYLRKARMEARDITAEVVQAYLDSLTMTGLKYRSADAAGISITWIRKFRLDEDFVELEEQALELYRETLVQEAHRRAVVGWEEPIIGGQFKDQVVCKVRKYDSRLLELMLKRHIPEFREKWEGEVKVTGGVLVAPVQTPTAASWAEQYGGRRLSSEPASGMLPAQEGPKALPTVEKSADGTEVINRSPA